ncbi:MAG: response regulator [Agathobacter sp.]|nr:response regulator [Agathobacter sp.]
MGRNSILIADDFRANRKILAHIFEEQFDIFEAEDGQATIDILNKKKDEIVLVFLDLKMPRKTGLDVLEYMKKEKLLDIIPVIMITGESTESTDVMAYESGVSEIIYKPFDATIVMRRAKNMIELYRHKLYLEDEIKEKKEELEEKNRELRKQQEMLEENNNFLIQALSSVIEVRSMESAESISRIKKITGILLNNLVEMYPEVGLSNTQIQLIMNASTLHDIGKISLPDSILHKQGELNEEEKEILKQHSINGCNILERFKQRENEFYVYCYDICRYHHERYDGSGYPDGLKGDEIPIWAQVVSVADVYNDMVTGTKYKTPFAADVAIKMILEGKCGAFSPKIMDCLDSAKLELYRAIENEID